MRRRPPRRGFSARKRLYSWPRHSRALRMWPTQDQNSVSKRWRPARAAGGTGCPIGHERWRRRGPPSARQRTARLIVRGAAPDHCLALAGRLSSLNHCSLDFGSTLTHHQHVAVRGGSDKAMTLEGNNAGTKPGVSPGQCAQRVDSLSAPERSPSPSTTVRIEPS